MRHELEKELQSKYLFMTIDNEPVYCQCGDGWYSVIDKLCKKIMETLSMQELADLCIDQIKEKYGTLRFYYSGVNFNKIEHFILEAEEESARVCDECGEEGKLREDKSYIQTLCDEHAEFEEQTAKRVSADR